MSTTITPQLAPLYSLPYLTFDTDESPLNFKNSAFVDSLVNSIQAFPTQPTTSGTQLNSAAFMDPFAAVDPGFAAFNPAGTGSGSGKGGHSGKNRQPGSVSPNEAMNIPAMNLPVMNSPSVNIPANLPGGGGAALVPGGGDMEMTAFQTQVEHLLNSAFMGYQPALRSRPLPSPGTGDTGSSTSPSSSSSASGSSSNPSVDQAVSQAVDILRQHGVSLSDADIQGIKTIIKYESGGNPNIVNTTDSNAAKGTPSTGLMQVIQPTFNAHALPGHNNIKNPVDNIIAGVRYAIARYGSVSNVPGVKAVNQGGAYVGY